jgi:hypothetical protein
MQKGGTLRVPPFFYPSAAEVKKIKEIARPPGYVE